MEKAIGHTFGAVTMLYIVCEVNGYPIKAFVDSGAQTMLICLFCSHNYNLEHLVDKRFFGMAYGVETQKIIDRIHQAPPKLGGTAVPESVLSLINQPDTFSRDPMGKFTGFREYRGGSTWIF